MDSTITNEWKGYTLDEIRVKRIMCLTHIELEKSKFLSSTQNYTNIGSRTSSVPFLGKIYNALDYLDYASLAFTMVRKVMRIFRHKK